MEDEQFDTAFAGLFDNLGGRVDSDEHTAHGCGRQTAHQPHGIP